MQPGEDNLANFMAITGCSDSEKATQYLSMTNSNLEQAVGLFLELEQQQQQQQQQQQPQNTTPQKSEDQQFVQDYNTSIFNSTNPAPQLIKQQSTPNQSLVLQYRKFLEEQSAKDDGFIKKVFNSSLNMFKGIFTRQPDPGSEFQQYLQSKRIKVNINFNMGNFKQNLTQGQEEMKPLLVYMHEPAANGLLDNLLQTKNLVTVINKNYRSLGFLVSEQIMATLPNIVPIPSITIYRINFIEQIQLMEVIPITETTNLEELAIKLKQIKGIFNKTYIQEEQAKKEVNKPPQYMGLQQQQQQQQQQYQQQNYSRVSPNAERENLRYQQEEAYKLAELKAQEKMRKEQAEKEKEQKRLQEELEKQEQLQLLKAQILSSMPDEPQEGGLGILFRLPDGQSRMRRFNLEDKVQTLFDFVQCQSEEHFITPSGEFDLIQNFPRLSLKTKEEQQLKEVFIDSTDEQLIVEEQ